MIKATFDKIHPVTLKPFSTTRNKQTVLRHRWIADDTEVYVPGNFESIKKALLAAKSNKRLTNITVSLC